MQQNVVENPQGRRALGNVLAAFVIGGLRRTMQ